MLERKVNIRVRSRSKCKVLSYIAQLVGIVVRARPIAWKSEQDSREGHGRFVEVEPTSCKH
jgi:hypothetical protein